MAIAKDDIGAFGMQIQGVLTLGIHADKTAPVPVSVSDNIPVAVTQRNAIGGLDHGTGLGRVDADCPNTQALIGLFANSGTPGIVAVAHEAGSPGHQMPLVWKIAVGGWQTAAECRHPLGLGRRGRTFENLRGLRFAHG